MEQLLVKTAVNIAALQKCHHKIIETFDLVIVSFLLMSYMLDQVVII